jgi:C-terminal processing protease CtpA/Prc
MKKKNIITISLVIVFIILMAALSGCSLGRFAFNFKHKGQSAKSFNEKQESNEKSNFKNKKMFKQNNENIPFIGIEMSQTAKDVKGVLVNSVIAGSPAETAGIKPQDIITTFNGQTVNSPNELYNLVLKSKVGDNVKIIVSRNGQNTEVSLTLTAFPTGEKNIEQNRQNRQQNSEQDKGKTY